MGRNKKQEKDDSFMERRKIGEYFLLDSPEHGNIAVFVNKGKDNIATAISPIDIDAYCKYLKTKEKEILDMGYTEVYKTYVHEHFSYYNEGEFKLIGIREESDQEYKNRIADRAKQQLDSAQKELDNLKKREESLEKKKKELEKILK